MPGTEWLHIEIAPPSAIARVKRRPSDATKQKRRRVNIRGESVVSMTSLRPESVWESRKDFAKRAAAQAHAEATAYYLKLEKEKKIMPAPARWVHYMRDGMSAGQIQRCDADARTISPQAIYKAVKLKAKELGLSLPARRGRTRRQ
jgi:hypothetical protein